MNFASFLTVLDFLGVSILDIVFTCVSFSFVREVRHTA
jgi:hypothetical protein